MRLNITTDVLDGSSKQEFAQRVLQLVGRANQASRVGLRVQFYAIAAMITRLDADASLWPDDDHKFGEIIPSDQLMTWAGSPTIRPHGVGGER